MKPQAMKVEPLPIDHKSGFVVYCTLNGQLYTVGAICECEAPALALYAAPRPADRPHEMTVKLYCTLHGEITTLATLQQVHIRTHRERAIFAAVEERFHRDPRPQWGKVAKE